MNEHNSHLIIHEFYIDDKPLVNRYELLLAACPNAFIQQSIQWSMAIKDEGPDVPIFLLIELDGEAIAGMPLYLFKGDWGNIITSIPQPGPIGGVFFKENFPGNEKINVYQEIFNYIDSLAVKYDCILFSTTTNPVEEDYNYYKTVLNHDFELKNFSQIINLNEIQNRSHGVRNNINKSEKYNLIISQKVDVNLIEKWYEIHQKRHKEIGITPINKNLILRIISEIINKRKGKLITVFLDNILIAGGIFIYHVNIMDLYMLSFDRNYLKVRPNYFLINEALKIAANKGIKYFNWQSSDSKKGGVFEFKRQWGSYETQYYLLTKLYCSESKIKSIGLKNIKMNYRHHFLVPFGYFNSKSNQRSFIKGEDR